MSRKLIRKVSVVIPAYNAESFLLKSVNSAIVQGDVVLEVIIVNNNSTDGTAKLIDDLIREHPGKVIAINCTAQGPAAARNAGIGIACGEWIQFLDADDYLYPGKIARQLELVEADTDWITGISDVLKEGKVTTTFTHTEDPWKGLVLCSGLGDTNANLFRREALLAVSGYDESQVVGEDYHLYFKLLQQGKRFVRDFVPGSAYVQHSASRGIGRGIPERMKWRLGFVLEIIKFLKTNHSDNLHQENAFFNSAKICALRMYMTADFEGAKLWMETVFPDKLDWKQFDKSTLPVYAFLYPLLGFVRTESIRLLLRNFLRKT